MIDWREGGGRRAERERVGGGRQTDRERQGKEKRMTDTHTEIEARTRHLWLWCRQPIGSKGCLCLGVVGQLMANPGTEKLMYAVE